MVWPFSSSDSRSSENHGSDPLKDLDPGLREFLEKESPVKYKTAEAPSLAPQITASPNKSTQNKSEVPAQASSYSNGVSTTTAPAQSLHSDGRYAHLWSTYRPLSEIENATKTDQEKLLDVLNGFKERKAQIGRAALENCAIEQWAVTDCYNSGKIMDRMRLCHAENRDFSRCYNMQARFLKALGYLSTYDRPPEIDEQIQMHADSLYHQMLEREKAVEEAKAAGLPIPTFPNLMTASGTPSTSPTQPRAVIDPQKEQPLPGDLEELKPKIKEQIRHRLKGLSPEEREIEERALQMEMAAGDTIGKQLGQLFEETGKAKRLRREQGKETVGDKISSLFGW